MADEKGKIIFVNSYKGGAGKTTLSLMHCITDLFYKKEYTNVIYMDLDTMGTGTCYLFKDNILPEDKCFEKTGQAVRVDLNIGTDAKILHVAYLNPSLKNSSVYRDNRPVNHRQITEKILEEKILKYIKDAFKAEESTLIVLDCAPGFSEFEQEILIACHRLKVTVDFEIEEYYVSTMDSAHIEKCIRCLNDSRKDFPKGIRERKIHVVINDMQNYEKYIEEQIRSGKRTKKAQDEWLEIKEIVKERLQYKDANIHRWKYCENIAVRTVFHNEQKIENHIDDYIFSAANYID